MPESDSTRPWNTPEPGTLGEYHKGLPGSAFDTTFWADNPALKHLLENPNYGIDPSPDAYSDASKEQDIYGISDLETIEAYLRDMGFDYIKANYLSIENKLASATNPIFDPQFVEFIDTIIAPQNAAWLGHARNLFPRLDELITAYHVVMRAEVAKYGEGTEAQNAMLQQLADEYLKSFGDGFEWAYEFRDTQDRLAANLEERSSQDSPASIGPLDMRIGGSRFLVPPVNINVSMPFQTGALSGGAIRQQSSPKFNSGHVEPIIELTLYFPTHESIWGLGDSGELDIDFDKDPDSVVDRFISSLRGLITEFKYAPFLPVRNDYLNRVWNSTAVAMHSMSVSTVEGFPFCLAVNLQLLKFNHKVYLPPINDFNSAIHWGRFRQYIGRAAQKMNSVTNQGFLVERFEDVRVDDENGERVTATQGIVHFEGKPTVKFNRERDWAEGKNFRLYYPKKTPGKIFTPDDSGFRQPGEDATDDDTRGFWDIFLNHLGFSVDTEPESLYDTVQQTAQGFSFSPTERQRLTEFLTTIGPAEAMTRNELEDYIAKRTKDMTGERKTQVELEIKRLWFNFIFSGWKTTPFFQAYFDSAEFADAQYIIKEWMVPMEEVAIDWKNVIVNGISVTLANNIVKLQLQMQEEPTYQHLGGRDSRVDVSMTVFGEDDLIRIRRMFEHINGLARLEQAHGVLGFLGIKNVVSALCGIKYVLPLSYEVDSMPGYPHVYSVRLSFVDFDIEQQRREELSTSQQAQLIEAFGKRNPFLRIKQMWGAFNAYPDFPLSVRNKSGDIVGHLEPDYYFRVFQTFDDDVVYWGLEDEDGSAMDDQEIAAYYMNNDPNLKRDDVDKRRIANIKKALENIHLLPEDRRALQEELDALTNKPTNTEGIPPMLPRGIEHSVDATIQSRTNGYKHKVTYAMGIADETQSKGTVLTLEKGCKVGVAEFDKKSGTTKLIKSPRGIKDQNPDSQLGPETASIPGLVTSFSQHTSSYFDGGDNPYKQFELMMTDAQYRDISGRMVRAFPTYMLWLIDEGGRFAGVKLFDNFYGLQSVIDFSLHASEDILGDTLVLRVSNLYRKLTTPFKNMMFSDQGDEAESSMRPIEVVVDRQRNIDSGTYTGNDPTQGIVEIEHIRLRPGVRVHLRAGYSANPNQLHTIFNGVVTTVTEGEIVEIVAQSDAIELSPQVNTTNEDGDSGKIDGALNTGLWMSEPRDLMVRLLSMGSGTFRESLAHATNGMIFSENKFGIRHFGQIMYEPLTEDEQVKQDARFDVIKSTMDGFTSASGAGDIAQASGQAVGNPAGFYQMAVGDAATRSPVTSIMQSMWSNFFKKRDYELFKRNIYPGNGTGIAQFLGADPAEGGLAFATGFDTASAAVESGNTKAINPHMPKHVTPPGSDLIMELQSAEDVQATSDGSKVDNILDQAKGVGLGDLSPGAVVDLGLESASFVPGTGFSIGDGLEMIGGVFTGKGTSPILQAFGIFGTDEDLDGYDEVSFRAQTYMKSVWDLFKLCAALLPNYIVSVRPFEDRSTVFYGKPHWLYTSGVIPLTTGVPPDKGPKIEGPDEELGELMRKAMNTANALADLEAQNELFEVTAQSSPYQAAVSVGAYSGAAVNDLPLQHPSGAEIPARKGKTAMEMHLPTSENLEEDISQHMQLPDLPENVRHPWYMDRAQYYEGTPTLEGGRGGYADILDYNPSGTILEGDSAEWPGRYGAFGFLTPQEEQWYIAMRWPYTDELGSKGSQDDYRKLRILVYNPKTEKACVCCPGDWGPHGDTGRILGPSPDVAHVLGLTGEDEVIVGLLADDTPLGPTDGTTFSNASQDYSAWGSVNTGRELTGGVNGLTNERPVKTSMPESKGWEEAISGHYAWEDIESELESAGDVGVGFNVLEEMERFRFTKSDIPTDDDDEEYWLRKLGVNRTDLDKAENNPILYAWEYGFLNPEIPVWIIPESGEATIQQLDITGITARRFYDKDYNKGFADQAYADGKNYGPENWFQDHSDAKESGGRTLADAQQIWSEFRNTGFLNAPAIKHGNDGELFTKWKDGTLITPNEEDGAPSEPILKPEGTHQELVDEWRRLQRQFMRFMWQDPYARAWLVMTTSRILDGTNFGGGLDIDAPGSDDSQWDFGGSTVVQAFEYFIMLKKTDDEGNENFDEMYKGEYGFAKKKLHTWLKEHNIQGVDSDSVMGRAVENLGNALDKSLGRVWRAVTAGLSGLISLYRISMMQLGYGLESVGHMQQQANIMNRVFNDSIYYAAGTEGSLLRMADNPFTREYGEPVVEIREPFQRVHYIDSFQHIIANSITESNNVSTVVTASSDGKYPVTVYFDRGAPPERQVETTTETGIFWDNARGGGVFGFLHPLLHPIETMRGFVKTATGTSDELTSKRIALTHLKEQLQDIYSGTVTVIGRPDIRPHDLVYIADIYSRMYGFFEVEAVTHHMTPDMGFVTEITPNAMVTINDPARWAMLSWIWSWMSVKNIRDDVRSMAYARGASSTPFIRGDSISGSELEQSLLPQMKGHLQYSHGNSAIVKDLVSHAGAGLMDGGGQDQANEKNTSGTKVGETVLGVMGAVPGLNLVADVAWDGWTWVRDNLLDQHGCYIQYLTKDGQPMDAGLSYNQGIAVGQHHNRTLLPGILGLDMDVFHDGHKRITTNDLLSALGWKELDIQNLSKEVSWWVNQTTSSVMKAAGKSPDALPFTKPEVVLLKVDHIRDPDTFEGKIIGAGGRMNIRLAGVNAVEAPKFGVSEGAEGHSLAARGEAYLRKRLYDDPIAMGHEPIVAVRMSGDNIQTYDRTAAVVFHNPPEGTTANNRAQALRRLAETWPIIEWDSYDDAGRPYTINWEMISTGYANVMFFGNEFDPGRGAVGLGRS